jgi:hypothetical protein
VGCYKRCLAQCPTRVSATQPSCGPARMQASISWIDAAMALLKWISWSLPPGSSRTASAQMCACACAYACLSHGTGRRRNGAQALRRDRDGRRKSGVPAPQAWLSACASAYNVQSIPCTMTTPCPMPWRYQRPSRAHRRIVGPARRRSHGHVGTRPRSAHA